MLHVRRLLNSTVPRHRFNVLVVGGGHAGCEAASAAARMGASTVLVTHKFETIGEMSCNPSFGGIGKGHLLRELDALGGLAPNICDHSGISYKVLNRSKGPAVWGHRAQMDRAIFKANMQKAIEQHPNLDVYEGSVEDLRFSDGRCAGVVLESGEEIEAQAVILTTGTFLKAMINIGEKSWPAGRFGDRPSIGLANTLDRLGFRLGRLKTGTPPRLIESSIDFRDLDEIENDNPPVPFSFMNDAVWLTAEQQIASRMTYTNEEVEKVVLANMHRNRHVNEETNGPRYCPSIESKVLRFRGRVHQVYLEPEGFDSGLIYPNGISCTLPADEQLKLVRCMKGCEKAEIARAGYGVEYDYIDPRELHPTLETKKVPNLFFAGQINGTTGYEEAAAQGVVAGVNAVRRVDNAEAVIFSRMESNIGVLIDDLTTHGTMEPYRMFTSRSEFRLYLRPDNADVRLTEKGYRAGCVDAKRYARMVDTRTKLENARAALYSKMMSATQWSQMLPTSGISQCQSIRSGFQLLNHETLDVDGLLAAFDYHPDIVAVWTDPKLWERLRVECLYEQLVKDQLVEIRELTKHETTLIPADLDYSEKRLNLSKELQLKLEMTRPSTIGAASRIQGMTPTALLRLIMCARTASTGAKFHQTVDA
ncbi:protein MTO1 -like protein [Tropilaelaps mercedesae]|uniref:Protein MTO1-like protein n=1 Tax=Tropilaelaps mercedesae TaxID=418985 RepID=A0A1V9X749_9ACAR|nr:protein MTO1 -like protein [Tropilaelaps mercedesae]